jgi:hypothetical protein
MILLEDLKLLLKKKYHKHYLWGLKNDRI